jgi:hypothetical protein
MLHDVPPTPEKGPADPVEPPKPEPAPPPVNDPLPADAPAPVREPGHDPPVRPLLP